MENHLKEAPKGRSRTHSVQAFAKRVIITLTVLVAVFSAVVFFLVYLPLTAELEKSLVDNFGQLSYIRHAALQNNMNRGLEGARSLSSRTVIRDAILDYKDGKIDLDDLTMVTQSKYEDGAKALEYLLKAERFTDGKLIARYTAKGYENQTCIIWNRFASNDKISTALCLTDGHEYLMVRSPILSKGQTIGHDQLIFDLGDQIHTLCTETIQSELVGQHIFEDLISGANIQKKSDAFTLFHKSGTYYQAFHMQDDAHFISKQSGASLLEPVYRLSRQILFAGIGILIVFTMAVYFFVIRHAKNELEDGCSTLKHAISEANTDPLTKTGSRRFGEEFLSEAFDCFQKGEASPAVLLFDVDSLKQINDAHGHFVGDLVIRSVAEAIQKNTRSKDMLLRWGGDEFIGIFSGLSKENAMPFAQKLLHAVSNLRIETDAETIQPTISIGISYFKEEDCGFTDVINRADRAMYQSKSGGRNRAYEL